MMFDRPIPVADGIFQIRAIGARVTVLVENGEALLVDSGLPGSSAVILRGLKRLGMVPEQLTRVALTHFHPDHAGGLGQLVAGRTVAVAAHSSEADIIEGKVPLPTVMPERPLGDMTQPVVAKLMGRPVPVEQRLEDGDVIPFGTEVRVVHVPGHTEGSIALLLPEKGVVIVGDALQYKLARQLSLPVTLGADRLKQAIRSLEKLARLDFETICFSHFPALRRESREAVRRLVERVGG
jgi:glyoxylase-like metal-dependent hydrolase (beta-lactamase superfamily II)